MAISTRPQPNVPGTGLMPMRDKVTEIFNSQAAQKNLRPLIPKGVEVDAVVIEVYRAVTKNPEILKCTEESIVMAIAECLQVDLLIGKTIHLVPVTTKVGKNPDRYELRLNAWTDYKGDIELVTRSGAARSVDAQCVYEFDLFEEHQGTDPRIDHRPPALGKPRGKMIGAYAVAYITQTIKRVCVMSMADIEKIRNTSKQWNPEKVPVCPDWYAMKTPIHRVTKLLPKNPRLARVMAMFDRQERIDQGEMEDLDPSMRIESPSAAPIGAPADEVVEAEITPAPQPSGRCADQPAADSPVDVAQPECPKCGGPMWDNRAKKASGQFKPNAPDFSCKRKDDCGGKYWPGEWPPSTGDDTQEDLQF